MSMMKTLLALCFLLLTAHVESRRHGTGEQQYKLFVFGDSFADVGNIPIGDLSGATREWYEPYGLNDDNLPSGRFSNGIVQSDFLARILGHHRSPLPSRLSKKRDGVDPFGMNFAIGWARVTTGSEAMPSLDMQIDHFRRLLRDGTIHDDLSNSVALVAISGYDYEDAPDMTTDYDGFAQFIGNVTDGILEGVRKIQELGVPKVLLNGMHPLGCTPGQARSSRYTVCDRQGNKATDLQNKDLQRKLRHEDSVLLLDLYTMFTELALPTSDSTLSKFEYGLAPCCDSNNENGYCGQRDRRNNPMYHLCHDRKEHFYWDSFHPTQAGWRAVMELFEGPIKEFLDISW